MTHKRYGVLFVCLGNICRSPLGEGIFRHLVAKNEVEGLFEIDSAGTADYHVGELPHAGSIHIAEKHGISIVDQRGRQCTSADLKRWDYIIAMDDSNRKNLLQLDKEIDGKLYRLRDFDPNGPGDVPDPWGRGEDAFQDVYNIIYRSCENLLTHILKEHGHVDKGTKS